MTEHWSFDNYKLWRNNRRWGTANRRGIAMPMTAKQVSQYLARRERERQDSGRIPLGELLDLLWRAGPHRSEPAAIVKLHEYSVRLISKQIRDTQTDLYADGGKGP
jgi:hypothetical protein